jgi:arylsulfatase A-like enzyme
LVEENATHWPEEVFVQISESEVGRAIRTRRWKYSVAAPGRKAKKHPGAELYVEQFLYDLENDPHERDNLVRSPNHTGVRAVLRERLKHRMAAAGEAIPLVVPA